MGTPFFICQWSITDQRFCQTNFLLPISHGHLVPISDYQLWQTNGSLPILKEPTSELASSAANVEHCYYILLSKHFSSIPPPLHFKFEQFYLYSVCSQNAGTPSKICNTNVHVFFITVEENKLFLFIYTLIWLIDTTTALLELQLQALIEICQNMSIHLPIVCPATEAWRLFGS